MWNVKRQLRLEVLLQEKEQSKLSEVESQELQSLTADRMQAEAEALESSTRRINEAAEQTRAEVREIESQRRDLEELVREQEDYLAEVNALIAQMETRRRGWHSRYKRVTGRSLSEPISPAGPHQGHSVFGSRH